MTILFAGGGTLGPVMPLLAVWKALRVHGEYQGFFAGTPHGPEKAFVEEAGLSFVPIPVFRLPRHPSLEWLLIPLHGMQALIMSSRMLSSVRPDLVATAGGFTGVPLVWMARLRGIPVWVHAQDVPVTLSLRFTARFATLLTAAWEETARFLGSRAQVIGNPTDGVACETAGDFGFAKKQPLLLCMGGGGGAAFINTLVETLHKECTDLNILHITGAQGQGAERTPSYIPATLLSRAQMRTALSCADFVLSRAGMGTITDLAAFQKAAVFIPLPHSPQEANASALEKAQAGIVLAQEEVTAEGIEGLLRDLVSDTERRQTLGKNLHRLLRTDGAGELAEALQKLVKRGEG